MGELNKMLFKKEMAAKIRTKEKTETRRLVTNKRIYKVPSIQPIQENYFDKAKDNIKILKTWIEKLSDMKPENLLAEGGFTSLAEYLDYLRKINSKAVITPDLEVRAYRFEYLPPSPELTLEIIGSTPIRDLTENQWLILSKHAPSMIVRMMPDFQHKYASLGVTAKK